jgi:hypothetical protein
VGTIGWYIGVRPGDPRWANGLAPPRASSVARFVVPAARTRLLAEIGLVVPEERGLEAWKVCASFSLLCGRTGSGTKGSAPSISISKAISESGAKLEIISASPMKNSWWAWGCLLGIALVDFSRS